MPLSANDQFGPYILVSPLGEGGMGEVWKARDTRLDRTVALKVAKANFSERFAREARTVAALNHPNICTLHDVGPNYLVMELVEGAPLKGPLSVAKAAEIAGQILDALDAAHHKGITHRDLKPANILISKQGAKLLDFGLAKQNATLKEADATLTGALTGPGQILGTLQYMAPEQLQGKEADARSDIFAFGCVLYEMLSGRRAFEGASAASVIAAILERDPAPLVHTPPLDRLVRKCLAKDPDDRFQTARDLKYNLGLAMETPAAAAPNPSRTPWIVAALALAAAAIFVWGPWRRGAPAERPMLRLDVDLGADVSLPRPINGGTEVVISPDGTQLAYTSLPSHTVFLRPLDRAKATELPGTAGASRLFFSPDGKWIGFYTARILNKISIDGGPVTRIAETEGLGAGASWGEDGSVIWGEAFGRGLLRVPANGGAPEVLARTAKGELAFFEPQLLPGGKAILFGSPEGIEVLTLADRRRKLVVSGGTSNRYLARSDHAGYLVYINKATAFAVPFDINRLETQGTAVPVLEDVAVATGVYTAQWDFSRTGTLVYRNAAAGVGAESILQWVDAGGNNEPLRLKAGPYTAPALSPDGKRVALTLTGPGVSDIWVYDISRDAMTRLTFGEQTYRDPIWSPDGQYVVTSCLARGLYQVRGDGAGHPQVLTDVRVEQFPGNFLPDGKRLTYYELTGNAQIWTVPIELQGGLLKAGKPEPFLKSGFSDSSPAFSPDGRWLAYASNESGKTEVYVRPFPPSASGESGKWQVSNNGGTAPRWSPNGHDLLYRSGGQLMAASYARKGDAFVAEKPRVWIGKLGGPRWDLSPDGKRTLVLTPVEGDAAKREHEVVLIQNYVDELRRRFPGK